MQAILFIHGFTAEENDNRYLLEALKKDPELDVRTFFLPGHGPNPRVSLSYQDWIKACEQQLACLLNDYPTVTIIGHSMGGVLSTILASRHPEITQLILLAPAFYFGSPNEWWRTLFEKKEALVSLFRGSIQKWQAYPKHYVFEFRKLRHDYHNVPKQITCPTLLVHGTRDPVVPGKASTYVAQSLQGPHQLVWIENAGHQLFLGEQKEEVVQTILEKLKENREGEERWKNY